MIASKINRPQKTVRDENENSLNMNSSPCRNPMDQRTGSRGRLVCGGTFSCSHKYHAKAEDRNTIRVYGTSTRIHSPFRILLEIRVAGKLLLIRPKERSRSCSK